MSATELSEFPSDAFRAFLAIRPEQRELIKRFMECSDEVQSVVRSMFAVLEYAHSTNEDKQRAFSTIAEALLKPEDRRVSYRKHLTRAKPDSATTQPSEQRQTTIPNRLAPPVTQDASFADRLTRLLIEKNITQEELADRIECTQSAISKMLTRNARPRRATLLKLADALRVDPTQLWPQLEVAEILDSVSDFLLDRDLTPEQATSLEAASQRPAAKVKTRALPSRKRN